MRHVYPYKNVKLLWKLFYINIRYCPFCYRYCFELYYTLLYIFCLNSFITLGHLLFQLNHINNLSTSHIARSRNQKAHTGGSGN